MGFSPSPQRPLIGMDPWGPFWVAACGGNRADPWHLCHMRAGMVTPLTLTRPAHDRWFYPRDVVFLRPLADDAAVAESDSESGSEEFELEDDMPL